MSEPSKLNEAEIKAARTARAANKHAWGWPPYHNPETAIALLKGCEMEQKSGVLGLSPVTEEDEDILDQALNDITAELGYESPSEYYADLECQGIIKMMDNRLGIDIDDR